MALAEAHVSAAGLLKNMNTAEFLWFLCVFADCVPIVAKLNKLFQGDDTNYSVVIEQSKIASDCVRAQIAHPGKWVSKYPELVKACEDRGFFGVGKPGSPARTPQWRELERVKVLTSVSLGLIEDMKVAPALAALQGLFHIEKWPASFKNPADKPSAEQMAVYFEPHMKEIESWYCGVGKRHPTGTVAAQFTKYQATLVDRVISCRGQYLVDEKVRREKEAVVLTEKARRRHKNAPRVGKAVTHVPLPECARAILVNPIFPTEPGETNVFTDLAHVAAIAPAGAAACERGVSLMKQLLTALSNSMKQDLFEAMMFLIENRPFPFKDKRWMPIYIAALHLFVRKTERRVCLALPRSELLEDTPNPPGWTEDHVWGQTFTDEPKWKLELERIRKIEVVNRRKCEVVSDAQATGTLKLVTGESVPFIPEQGDMSISEGDRIFHWWKDCGDKDKSSGWLEGTVLRICGNTNEFRYWTFYSCDKKEARHDFDPYLQPTGSTLLMDCVG